MTTSSVSPVTTELAGSETGITLVIHAGAGSRGKHSTPERIAQVELDLHVAATIGGVGRQRDRRDAARRVEPAAYDIMRP